MARRGGRGTGEWSGGGRDAGGRGARGKRDEEPRGSWSLGDYEWPTGDQTGPPWDQPDWEGPPPSTPGRPLGGLSAGHPSGPLPRVGGGGHPSGPLPPVRGRPALPGPAGGRPGRDYDTGGFPAAGYDTGSLETGPYDTGSFRNGSYDTGGYDAVRYHPGAFDTGSYQAAGYDTGSYDTGSWDGADYDDEEPPTGMGFARGGLGYPGGTGAVGRGFADEADGYAEEDYEAEDEWYEDDQHDWVDDEDEEDFLPGLRSVSGSRTHQTAERARGGKGQPKRKRGRRAVKVLLLTFVLILLGGGGGAGYYVWTTYLHPRDYSGPGAGSVMVHISSGDSATTIGEILQRDGVVASARAFHNAAVSSPSGNALEPGYYLLHKHMQASLALAMLLKPSSRYVIKVLIREGLRLSQIIATLGKDTHNLAGYQAAIKDVSKLGLPSYASGKPEGFLFPDTYNVWPSTPPAQVLQEMVQQYTQVAKSLQMPRWAAHLGLTERQIVIVASLIQAEGNGSDFSKIARVIYNRLYVAGMPLQLDSTVMYALNKYGIAATPAELAAAKKSRYDTYTHTGLPPGPIDSPGRAALYAALHPATGNWLYFVTVNPKTGLTKFTSDPNQFSTWEAQFRAKYGQG